jgi:hypothetical protein
VTVVANMTRHTEHDGSSERKVGETDCAVSPKSDFNKAAKLQGLWAE